MTAAPESHPIQMGYYILQPYLGHCKPIPFAAAEIEVEVVKRQNGQSAQGEERETFPDPDATSSKEPVTL